jgi:hypothetical protein
MSVLRAKSKTLDGLRREAVLGVITLWSLEGVRAGLFPESLLPIIDFGLGLPPENEREYTLTEAVDALYCIDGEGRYRWRIKQ